MNSWLINKNLCFYYWLRPRLGRQRALKVAKTIEAGIVFLLGREVMA